MLGQKTDSCTCPNRASVPRPSAFVIGPVLPSSLRNGRGWCVNVLVYPNWQRSVTETSAYEHRRATTPGLRDTTKLRIPWGISDGQQTLATVGVFFAAYKHPPRVGDCAPGCSFGSALGSRSSVALQRRPVPAKAPSDLPRTPRRISGPAYERPWRKPPGVPVRQRLAVRRDRRVFSARHFSATHRSDRAALPIPERL